MEVWDVNIGKGIIVYTNYKDAGYEYIRVQFDTKIGNWYSNFNYDGSNHMNNLMRIFPYEVEIVRKPEFKRGDYIWVSGDGKTLPWYKVMFLGFRDNGFVEVVAPRRVRIQKRKIL